MACSMKEKDKKNMGRVERRPMWLLWFGIIVRAIHQVGVAVYLVSYLFPNAITLPRFYLYLAIISGVVLFFTEWSRHREIYREFVGVATFIKLGLLGAAFHGLLPPTLAVLAAFLLAAIAAHAPKDIRHKLLY